MKKKSSYYFLIQALCIVFLASCIGLRDNSGLVPGDASIVNQAIILDMQNIDASSNKDFFSKVYFNPNLKFRDYLPYINSQGLYRIGFGCKPIWGCVVDKMPDTSQNLLSISDSHLDVLLSEEVDTVGKIHYPIYYYSPVFETKVQGIYAFHRSVSTFMGDDFDLFNRIMDGDTLSTTQGASFFLNLVVGKFVRFRIVDGTIEWLDCCGYTSPWSANCK